MSDATAPSAMEDGSRSLSREALDEAIGRELELLDERIAPHARCALLADNGCGWAIADLALHARRSLNVPLPGYFSDAQLRHALDDAGVDVVLTDDATRVVALGAGFLRDGDSPWTGLARLRRDRRGHARPEVPAGTTKITYTSGSTGAPKGVCLSAAAIEQVARSLADATRPLDARRHLCLLPLATLLDNIAGLYAAPLAGAGCVLPSTQATGIRFGALDVPRLLACIAGQRPESMILVPELLRVLVAAAERGWPVPRSLKFVAVGGASVSPALLERAVDLGLPVFEGYGLSECASVVALNPPGARRAGSAGRVLPHASVRVAADGEIHVRGVTMLGYLGDADRAGASDATGGVRASGEVGASGEVATGDLGELDADGYLYVRGRRKNLFITSFGRNVAPEWLERELLLDASIGQAMAWGEGRPHAVALVVPSRPEVSDAQVGSAVAAANARLPEYARMRRWAVLRQPFSFEDGSLTANGRVRRDVVRARHAALLDALYDTALAS